MEFVEQENAKLRALTNKHWREVAEYERYVTPLLICLDLVEWPDMIAEQKDLWHGDTINEMKAKKRRLSWSALISYSVPWDSRFQLADLTQPTYTLAGYKQRAYEVSLAMWGQVIEHQDAKTLSARRRQYLANRLRVSSSLLGRYEGARYEGAYKLEFDLTAALAGKTVGYGIDPAILGQVEAKLNYFWRCLKDFHEAELTAPATTVPGGSVASSDTIRPKQPPVSPSSTVADLCRDEFTPKDVLALAREIGLTDEAERYCLGERKLSAVVGFCVALEPKLTGTIPERVNAVGALLGVEIRTRKTGTGPADKYRRLTEKALARRGPTH